MRSIALLMMAAVAEARAMVVAMAMVRAAALAAEQCLTVVVLNR